MGRSQGFSTCLLTLMKLWSYKTFPIRRLKYPVLCNNQNSQSYLLSFILHPPVLLPLTSNYACSILVIWLGRWSNAFSPPPPAPRCFHMGDTFPLTCHSSLNPSSSLSNSTLCGVIFSLAFWALGIMIGLTSFSKIKEKHLWLWGRGSKKKIESCCWGK